MKTKAIHLKVGQTVKFKNAQGTHTMKLTSIGRADRNELMFRGIMVNTTFKPFGTSYNFDRFNVGAENFFFARYKTQFEVL